MVMLSAATTRGFQGACPRLAFVLLLLLVAPVTLQQAGVLAELVQPGFWETTNDELLQLVRASQSYLRPLQEMGGTAQVCTDVPGREREEVQKLDSNKVSVVVMDKKLLCQDFAITCDLTKEETEAWLIHQAAWFSVPHIMSGVEPVIPLETPVYTKTGSRACAAGRALLLPIHVNDASNQGNNESQAKAAELLMDVKGIGARTPELHSKRTKVSHKNGLIALAEALYEYVNEKTVSAILHDHKDRNYQDSSQHFSTVGCYAVLSLGFEIPIEGATGTTHYQPAGATVRQASRRHPNPYGFMDVQEAATLELILNGYGIGSDSANNDKLFLSLPNPYCQRINIQGTMQPRTMVDFNSIFGHSHTDGLNASDCWVHWAGTHHLLDKVGLAPKNLHCPAAVKQFILSELEHRPEVKQLVYPFRASHTARMKRIFLATDAWYYNNTEQQVSLEELQGAVLEGMIDDLLASERLTQQQQEAQVTKPQGQCKE